MKSAYTQKTSFKSYQNRSYYFGCIYDSYVYNGVEICLIVIIIIYVCSTYLHFSAFYICNFLHSFRLAIIHDATNMTIKYDGIKNAFLEYKGIYP